MLQKFIKIGLISISDRASSGVYEEWYQIKDGKLISWHQTKRSLTQTPTAE